MSGFTFDFPPGTALERPAPPGFRLLERHRILGARRGDLRRFGAQILAWEVQRRSGIAVEAPGGGLAPDVAPGLEVRLRVPLGGAGPLAVHLSAPARVTRVVDERYGIGFAYGTLAGHPEIGEESFVVRLMEDGRVRLTVRAISKPAFPYALAAPVGARYQRRFTERYLGALGD